MKANFSLYDFGQANQREEEYKNQIKTLTNRLKEVLQNKMVQIVLCGCISFFFFLMLFDQQHTVIFNIFLLSYFFYITLTEILLGFTKLNFI